LNKLYTEVCQ